MEISKIGGIGTQIVVVTTRTRSARTTGKRTVSEMRMNARMTKNQMRTKQNKRKNQIELAEKMKTMRNGKKSEMKWLNLEKLAITVMKRPVQN